MPRPDDELRARVASRLEALSLNGGPLYANSRLATVHAYPDARPGFRGEVIERVRRAQPGIRADGYAAIIMAGPTGAGKSTERDRRGLRSGWLRIDADDIKELLIEKAVQDRIYEDILATKLPDGHTVMPAELAPLVHIESSRIADQMRQESLAQGENILIDTTLTWRPDSGPGQGALLLDELARAGYDHVDIIDIEVSRETAVDRALDRWWKGRRKRATGRGGLGGRFVPASVINGLYLPDGNTKSHANVVEAFDSATAAEIDELRLLLTESGGEMPARVKRRGALDPQAQPAPTSPGIRTTSITSPSPEASELQCGFLMPRAGARCIEPIAHRGHHRSVPRR